MRSTAASHRTLLDFKSYDDVLEDLVHGVAGVKIAIGIGGAIMEDKCIVGRSIGSLPAVKVVGALLDILIPMLYLRTWTARSKVYVSNSRPKGGGKQG